MAKKQSRKKLPSKSSSKPRTKVRVAQAQGFSVWQLTLLSVSALIAAYIFASLAIDSGSMWHYLLCIASAYLVVRFTSQAIRTFTSERK